MCPLPCHATPPTPTSVVRLQRGAWCGSCLLRRHVETGRASLTDSALWRLRQRLAEGSSDPAVCVCELARKLGAELSEVGVLEVAVAPPDPDLGGHLDALFAAWCRQPSPATTPTALLVPVFDHRATAVVGALPRVLHGGGSVDLCGRLQCSVWLDRGVVCAERHDAASEVEQAAAGAPANSPAGVPHRDPTRRLIFVSVVPPPLPSYW